MKKALYAALAAFALSFPGVAFSQDTVSALEGKWYTTKPEKNVVIEIARCTPGGKTFCGKIVKLETPNYPDGTPKVDKNNKSESLRSRPLLGLQLLSGFTRDGENSWSDGKIYNPEDGDDYNCNIDLESDSGRDELQVRGYVGLPIFGKTQTWVRLKDGEKAPWDKSND